MPQDTPPQAPLATAMTSLAATVGDWPATTVHATHAGGHGFRLGAREFGHVHRSGLVDVNYGRQVRDALVDAGHTRPHVVHPNSGWTSYRLRDQTGVDRASWLLRLSYLATAITLSRADVGRRVFDAVDLRAELDALDPPAGARDELTDRATAFGVVQ